MFRIPLQPLRVRQEQGERLQSSHTQLTRDHQPVAAVIARPTENGDSLLWKGAETLVEKLDHSQAGVFH